MKSVSLLIILLFLGLPSAGFSEESKAEVIKVFREYVQLNDIFMASANKNSLSNKAYYDLLKAVEAYAEFVYNPILINAVSIVCENKDSDLLSEYFKVIISTRNSADEYPTLF